MLRASSSVAASPVLALTLATAAAQKRYQSLSVNIPKQDIDVGPFEFNAAATNLFRLSNEVHVASVENARKTSWRGDEQSRRIEKAMRDAGYFRLPILDYAPNRGLLPLFSAYQLRVHYGRHHRAYVNKLNDLVKDSDVFRNVPLDELVRKSAGDPASAAVFNNAAQHYNHSFFWKSLEPHGTNCPPDLEEALAAQYGSLAALQAALTEAAMGLFGSGWVYLVWDDGRSGFDILSLPNAGCPLTTPGITPLLACDVWEHAYYIDYDNSRAAYMEKYVEAVDWHWAERHWKRATGKKFDEMVWR